MALERLQLRGRRPSILAVVIFLLVVIGIFGALLAPLDPSAADLTEAFQAPSGAHLFGTDSSGRDILSRVLAGARTSLAAPLIVAIAATILGCGVALASAWNGGWIDSALSKTIDTLFSFPGLLLAILACAIFGTGLTAPVIALCIAYIPYIARIVRSAVLKEKASPYIEALSLQGFTGISVCWQHIVPNIRGTIGAQAAITFGYAMVDLAAINFLGLGLPATSPDWGVMVSAGQSSISRGRPEEALFAGLFIVITVVAANFLGYRLGQKAALELE